MFLDIDLGDRSNKLSFRQTRRFYRSSDGPMPRHLSTLGMRERTPGLRRRRSSVSGVFHFGFYFGIKRRLPVIGSDLVQRAMCCRQVFQ
jgi:hypothetical protein